MNSWDRCNGPMFFQFSKEDVMRSRLKLLRNVVVAAGIVVALGFGATEASGCLVCDPPEESCAGIPLPDVHCLDFCVNEQGCEWGMCSRYDLCECAEK